MRFSETPVTDAKDDRPKLVPVSDTPEDSRGTSEAGENGKSKEGSSNPLIRSKAASVIESIGTEFSRLRKDGRANAWADLEDRVAKAGSFLIDSGMVSMKDWTGMLIDIEQFRKTDAGNSEVPGDALARWLSEDDKKPKKSKAVQ